MQIKGLLLVNLFRIVPIILGEVRPNLFCQEAIGTQGLK
jgi:hypothetical protein